jgi:phospholipase C
VRNGCLSGTWNAHSERVPELARREDRGGSIGLGFSAPLTVASPWSGAGFVCPQVFDRISVSEGHS